MRNPIFTCNDCNSPITVYYHEGYGGKRGKCIHCGYEFPLE